MLMIGDLPALLGQRIRFQPYGRPTDDCAAIAGWGLKGVALKAKADADRYGLPYLALEDGFLRSISLGDTDPPRSVVVDDIGIYYNAQAPSRLERLIAAPHEQTEIERAQAVVRSWRCDRLSKYNHAREQTRACAAHVLVVDQTAGDASITYGLADEQSFRQMLEAALDEHPSLDVIVKVHPDVIAGRKRAHFDALTVGQSKRVMLLATDTHPPGLLEHAEAVYVVTSQMGFEALMWGKPVHTFGMPFYAGWGLTKDELQAPERRRTSHRVSLDDLVHAALVEYPSYIDPETLERCEVERVMDWLALQRRQRERFAPHIQAIAFPNWKRPMARAFFGGSTLCFAGAPVQRLAPLDESLADAPVRAVWGRPADKALVSRDNAPLLRVENGLLCSVGLSANDKRVQPLSWVIDRSGMYYDATKPSDLETLLETATFDETLLSRARSLWEKVVGAGITKHDVGSRKWQRPAGATWVVLVPGHVESEASITYGAPGLRTNLGLLQAARRAAPDAYLVYVPHPDVPAKKRSSGKHEHQMREHCDEVVTDVPIRSLLSAVDEVHVLTSLAGFEALLRGKRVVCHGLPFYAGWGLTEDLQPHPRRTRKLAIDELVAASLILYPTYVSRVSGAFTTPERALHELLHGHDLQPPVEVRWLGMLRRLKRARDRWRRR